MEERKNGDLESTVDLISGITERIAAGHDPTQLTELEGEQAVALRRCLLYIREWANCLLANVSMPSGYEGTLTGPRTIGGGITCTKMCDGAAEPNRAILIQVQKLRGLPETTILNSK